MHQHEHSHNSATNFLGGFLAGASLALLAGGFYLFGPDGRAHRKRAERVIGDMRDEILERLESMKEMTEEKYHELVDEVAAGYALGKRLSKAQSLRAAARFKSRWRQMKEAAEDATDEARLELEDEDV
jgi:hypothetical protein